MPTPEPTHLLAGWFGTPLPPAQARALLEQAQARRHPRGYRSRRCYSCRLQEMVARYWLGEPIEEDYRHLSQLLRRTPHGTALLELIYGQLLMSRRLLGARRHLDEGFRRAGRLLTAADFLHLLQRHQQLARLPLNATALPALDLPGLLTTAAVVERMTQGAPRRTTPREGTDDLIG